jgi:hypothetical protein
LRKFFVNKPEITIINLLFTSVLQFLKKKRTILYLKYILYDTWIRRKTQNIPDSDMKKKNKYYPVRIISFCKFSIKYGISTINFFRNTILEIHVVMVGPKVQNLLKKVIHKFKPLKVSLNFDAFCQFERTAFLFFLFPFIYCLVIFKLVRFT